MKLLPCFIDLLSRGWGDSFSDHRSYKRAVGFALAFLVCLGRRTISRAICAQQRQFRAWSRDYKFFSESPWDPPSLFEGVVAEAQFQADALQQRIGMKIPVSVRSILDNAWT